VIRIFDLEVTVIYTDYLFYSTVWRGTLSEGEFEKFALRACTYINSLTFGRAASVAENDKRRDNLAFCLCAVTDLLASASASGGFDHGTISSIKNDGFEVAYHEPNSNSANTSTSAADPLYSAAMFWLGSTGLLYCGNN